MNRVLTLLMAGALLIVAGIAQHAEKAAPPPESVRKVVELRHLSGARLDQAATLVNKFMHPVGSVNYDSNLKTAVLQGRSDVVIAAEALLRKFDTPTAKEAERRANQVQFTIYLIEAFPEAGQGESVPAAVSSAVEEMKKTFQYKSYRLLDTIFLQARNSGEVQGTLPDARVRKFPIPTLYKLNYEQAEVLEDGKTVAIRGLRFALTIPLLQADGTATRFAETALRTDLMVQEGQKLVVGKLSGIESRSAIFLIITADVR